MGREHPDRLVACLALADPLLPQAAQPARDAAAQTRDAGGTNAPTYGPSRRLKEVMVPEAFLLACLRAGKRRWVYHPPQDAHVVGCEANLGQRSLRLVLHSEDFPEVAEGVPIPALEKEWAEG
jgi:hypothetical protein